MAPSPKILGTELENACIRVCCIAGVQEAGAWHKAHAGSCARHLGATLGLWAAFQGVELLDNRNFRFSQGAESFDGTLAL